MSLDTTSSERTMANTTRTETEISTQDKAVQFHIGKEGLGSMQNDGSPLLVQQRIARQAILTPTALAVVMGKQQITYQDLNRRANQVAHMLQRQGVGPDVVVGLCIERSIDMVVALLGILKAGGAYLPLDPLYPEERLSYILNNAQVAALITQSPQLPRFTPLNVPIICLDRDARALAQEPTPEPLTQSTLHDLAYVIYTSGSTGRPKGVLIEQCNLLNLIDWHQRAFQITAADRATQVASPAFDATGWELWPYLTCGASLYLPDEETRISAPLLRDWLVNNAITVSFLPTALAEGVIALPWPEQTALRFLLTGADALHSYPPSDLPFAFVNNYGPTENTVVTTSGIVPPMPDAQEPPTLGWPIDNVQVYILDEQLQPLPTGVAGELCIAGAGLARGYLNRPDLTAEKFVHDPFSDRPEAKMYRTGDLARILPDGQIAFLGRIDHQIKLRGYRIEPNEIASVLNTHPAISSSIVIAREDTPGDKYLAAYIVPVEGEPLTVTMLQQLLLTYLPDYMVPALFVMLPTLPLTAHGKIDRAALPPPDETNILRDNEITAPETPVQQRLATIIAELLAIQSIGIDENFFMLGGHSLLGTQIIARISEIFEIKLTLRSLFDSPTIRSLAELIEAHIVEKVAALSDEDAQRWLEMLVAGQA